MGREGLRMGIFGTYRQQFSTEHQEATLVEMKERENKSNRHTVLHVLLRSWQLQHLEERIWSNYYIT